MNMTNSQKFLAFFSRGLKYLLLSLCLAVSYQTQAAEINSANYDIYYGDMNNDGVSDVYFSGKAKFVILHGDIAIPILIGYQPSYALIRNGASYYDPVYTTLSAATIAQKLQSGAFKLAVQNTDFLTYTNSVSGLPQLLLRGVDTNAPSIMLLSANGQDLPLIFQTYPINDPVNISDRNQPFSMADKNGDGLLDLVIGSYAYLADSSGIPAANNLVNAYVFVSADTYISISDPSGKPLGSISPDPDGNGPLKNPATRNTYNATNGRLEKVESGVLTILPNDLQSAPSSWSSFTVISSQVFNYDSYGRKISTTNYDKNAQPIGLTQVSYYGRLVTCQATRMNPTVYASLPDACSLSTEGTEGPDRITAFGYDELDQVVVQKKAYKTPLEQTYVTNTYSGRFLTSQTDANGNRTELRYNSKWQLEKVVYPSPTIPGTVNEADYVAFTYDDNGNKLSERKRNGAYIYYTPDNNNRVIVKDYADNTKQSDVYTDYDARGLLLSSRFNSTSGVGIINSFDGFGRLKTSTNNMGATSRTLTSDYDDNNNRKQLTHADGQKFSYTFDGLNRVSGVSDSATYNNNLLAVNYQTNGRRLNLTRTNGVVTSYNFNNGVQLSSFNQTFTSATNNLTNSFVFNPAGQITQLTQSNSSYYYVGNDNRTGAYFPDGLNRYTTVNGITQTYDGNSNLTNDGIQAYTYDDENRLLTANTIANGNNGTFVYDPNGRLFQSTIKGITRQYLYDGDALVAEYDGSNVLQKRYVHGDQVDEPWVEYNGASVASRIYLHSDHQGSIIALSDSNGTVTKFAYDGFGIPANNNSDTFGYTGQVYFKDLGINYYKARFYSPKLGRFLQTDPIGYKDDMNMYAYTGNDPLNMKDVSGKFAFPVHGLITFFAALNSGHGRHSFSIAWRAMTRDIGTQGSSKSDVAIHSMRAVNQPLAEARSNSQALIKSELAAGRLGNAAHTIQDAHAHAHENYKVWDGTYGGLKSFIIHEFTDLFPSPQRIADAYNETKEAFTGATDISEQSASSEQNNGNTNSSNDASNSDNGMSSGNVHFCSGMGAEKTGASEFCK